MNDEPIDFSPLDPKRSGARFERRVQAVLAGVTSAGQRPTLLLGLVRWGRVAVTVTALLALTAWVPHLASRETVTASHDPVELISEWAHQAHIPAHVDPIEALGEAAHGEPHVD